MAQDRYKYFRIEAREILDGLSRGLLDLENRADPAVTARLLRLAHTLKGAARIVGHRELADLAHRMEDLLAPLRDAKTPQRLDGPLAIVDQMAVHVAALQTESARPADQGAATGVRPTNVGDMELHDRPDTPGKADRIMDAPAPRVDPAALDDVIAGLAEIQVLLRRLRGVDDLSLIEPRVDQLEREVRVVRQDAERLRLLAAGTSFTSLERTARDVAHAARKRIRFTTSGSDVRVDAHVLTTLHGALVQAVRNAVAHGIEAPDERIAAGKTPAGEVAIAVALHGTRIAVTCRDDGRGIDLEAVRRVAVQRGLAAERVRQLDRDQLIDLLLRGGLTTSSEVTAFAGRGIGLDVVRDAAQALGGDVTVTTGAGGTAITITAPISVAALPALVLGAGERIAAVPLAAVQRVARSAAVTLVSTPGGLAVALDDLAIPFALLSRVLGAGTQGTHRSIAIIESSDGLAAIGADRVLGVEDIVVRALPAGAPVEPVVMGVALDAAGLPRPILEPRALVASIRAMPVTAAAPIARPLPILIVDDSLTTRMLEQSILASAGYEVDAASSAEEALDKVARQAYGLFLVDVEMPGMDGFELIAALRADPRWAPIPAILVTSRNRPDDRQRGAAVGAQGYVVKGDFDQTKLLDMIQRLVRT